MTATRETKIHTCKHGHTTEVHRTPSGQWSGCKECNRLKTKKRDEALKHLAADDEEKLRRRAYGKAYDKARYESRKEEKKAYVKAWREANREKINAQARERRKRAKESREHGSQEKT